MTFELRSDTFTRPTDAVRAAMARAVVGDDVWGEDPTVAALEERVAALTGKDAALFVPSGTMGNAIALRLHAGQGDRILVHEHAHIVEHEGGGPAALWGIEAQRLPGASGRIAPQTIAAVLPQDPDDVHLSTPRLVCVENSHMYSGGRVWSLDELAALAQWSHAHDLRVHMDGARVFNAAVMLGVPVSEIVQHADTVQLCLSKGLGAPVGSMLAGPHELMRGARRIRKLLGGGMRQAGVLAAAGLHVLDHHVARLADDHVHARRLADGLALTGGRLAVDPALVETNIVCATVTGEEDTATAVVDDLAQAGVLADALDHRIVRFVTSMEIDAAGIDGALAAAAPVLSS